MDLHRNEFWYYTKLSRWILLSIGIWPCRQYLSVMATTTCNLALNFSMIPCALYIAFEERDINIKLKLFGLISFCMTSAIKYCAVFSHRIQIERCIEHVKSDWRQVENHSDREVMIKYTRLARNLTVLSVIFMYGGGVIYHMILPFVSYEKFLDEHNQTIRPFVYPIYTALYTAQKSPIYEFVYFGQCLCGYVIYSITVGICGLAAIFAMHCCAQIEILKMRVENLVNGKRKRGYDDKIENERLIAIVKLHLRTLRFSAVMGRILREVCLVELISSTIIICLLEYYCLTDWKDSNVVSLFTYILLLMSISFNMFLLCYIGDLLTEKSSKIGLRCFMIEWYYLPPKTARGIILIIAMSNSPIKLSAGKLTDLTLSTFGAILKTSLAYLSFLRTSLM